MNELSQFFEKNSLTKCPNKDNVDNATIGKINLIKLAHDSRNKCKILRMKSFEELFPSNSDESDHASPIVNEHKMRKSINKKK